METRITTKSLVAEHVIVERTRYPVTKITVDGEEWVPRVYDPIMKCPSCQSLYLDECKACVYDAPPSYPKNVNLFADKPQFKVGDFVRVLPPTVPEGPGEDSCGKVVGANKYEVGVEFPHPFDFGHDLGGTSTAKHGWYFPPSHLELI